LRAAFDEIALIEPPGKNLCNKVERPRSSRAGSGSKPDSSGDDANSGSMSSTMMPRQSLSVGIRTMMGAASSRTCRATAPAAGNQSAPP
jgi:hypothetical protein